MLLATFFPGFAEMALAEGTFHPVSGKEIRTLLTDAQVDYIGKDESAWQFFHADGRTLYGVGSSESWGRWSVREDQYCSTWPPSSHESCYEMTRQGNTVRFIGPRGDVYEGEVK
ncbi:hypothetical protein O2N63_07300 [Aliiroseovarius sp. KMU-50]|uniref:DUF995 domain-containing protein n=1 Tax=Aliiroseovarius salicola TaxID=3009082 RepID=A0ABT4W059_9RHOB|nr:hypothetical protein [Aliiroseovarius sp. KMU-50]MDA5093890.1 hypothetical protein [Aliiroseovarius sp. KMU-50]